MTYLEAELAFTQHELERLRMVLDLTILATRSHPHWAGEYLATLKDVVWLERKGYCLSPGHPAFIPQQPLI